MTLIAVSIRLSSCSQHRDGSLMLAERRGMLNESAQAMNEAETRLIRSPLLCSALRPRKHQNDLLFLLHGQKPLNVFLFWTMVRLYPLPHITAGSPIGLNCAFQTAIYKHMQIHTEINILRSTHKHTLHKRNVLG